MTEAQKRVFDEIAARQEKRTIGPSLREVARAIGCAGNAVQNHVIKLRREGLIAPDDGCGLVLTPSAKQIAGAAQATAGL